tara:strand:- start:374 stop:613 length:240 start_codon:yes stop_codon:yes gene_type:complete
VVFFWSFISIKNWAFNQIVRPIYCQSTKKEKMSKMKYQLDNCSIIIKPKLSLKLRVLQGSFNCSLLPLKVMGGLKGEKI